MKTKILSLAVIAGVFTGCSQLNLPTLPQPQAMGINHELIKDIKTDGKGGYYVTKEEDCDNLRKAGAMKVVRSLTSKDLNDDECKGVVRKNILNDAIGHDLFVFKPMK